MPVDDDSFYKPPKLNIYDSLKNQVMLLLEGNEGRENPKGFKVLRACVYELGMEGKRGKWYFDSVDVHNNLWTSVKGEVPKIDEVVKALDGLVAHLNEIDSDMLQVGVQLNANDRDRLVANTVMEREKLGADIKATYAMLKRQGAKIERPPEMKKIHSKYLTRVMLGMNGSPGGGKGA